MDKAVGEQEKERALRKKVNWMKNRSMCGSETQSASTTPSVERRIEYNRGGETGRQPGDALGCGVEAMKRRREVQ